MTSGENNSGWKHFAEGLSCCFVLGFTGPLVPRHGCWLGLSPGQADEEELRQAKRCFCGLPWCIAGVAIAMYQFQAAVTDQDLPPGGTASWWHFARLLSAVACALLAIIGIGTEDVFARQNTLYASCMVGCFINPCINALMMGQPLRFTAELVLQRLGATLSFGCLFFVFLGQVSLLLLVTVNLSFMFGVVMNAVFAKESVSDPSVPFERSVYPWLAIVCFGMVCYGSAALAKCRCLQRRRATTTVPQNEKLEGVMPNMAATDSGRSAEVNAHQDGQNEPSGRPVREAWAPS